MPPSPAFMEIIAIIVAGLVGWQNGTLGKRELQIIALVGVSDDHNAIEIERRSPGDP